MRKNPYEKKKELEEIKERNLAVALKYDLDKNQAPVVVASGRGLIADGIVEKAKESGVPIQSDPTLVQLLSQLNINEAIPEELYQVVAEVFAFVYRVDHRMQSQNKLKLEKNIQ